MAISPAPSEAFPSETRSFASFRAPRPSWPLALGGALALSWLVAGALSAQATPTSEPPRVRARALGVAPGVFAPGAHNAITDVLGVRVGHATVRKGDSLRTGVTVIVPHGGDLYRERVPAAVHVGNGFGKLLGVTQLRELGELETPIALTCTLCIWQVGDALAQWMLTRPGLENVRSINPVVGETNDGGLNTIRTRPGLGDALRRALTAADTGAVAEGSVGAGTGTNMFGWKGGIGTSSRRLPEDLGGHTVGVLVQGNFGGVLQVLGAPMGRELGQFAFQRSVAPSGRGPGDPNAEVGDGSIMIVVATDAPLSDRNLERVAARAIMGLARTGSSASNGSGDYVIAFSTAASVRRGVTSAPLTTTELANDDASALFQATVEATEEAIYNALFMATTERLGTRRVDAIPLDRVREVLGRYNVTNRPR
ncbi:MAG: P1 family peptidase [Gemmatimonadaceae bacterium]|jgi:D-aminopeptidase|nr:P1 family peptidase [Gemmatimonadaceae bacterium]